MPQQNSATTNGAVRFTLSLLSGDLPRSAIRASSDYLRYDEAAFDIQSPARHGKVGPAGKSSGKRCEQASAGKPIDSLPLGESDFR